MPLQCFNSIWKSGKPLFAGNKALGLSDMALHYIGGILKHGPAILAFTKCLALELSPRIQVNCLIPSAVDTPEVRERYKLDTKEGLDSVVSGIPMGRLGNTEDVVQMIRCILSSSFTTGSTFYVNGGEYMS